MKFTKMQGIGNDYIYVNCFEERVADPSALAVRASDRHFGIGGDGVILICPSDRADARMEMYNADGSRGKMCGNGIRCVAKFVHDHGICRKDVLRIDTDAGIKEIRIAQKDEKGRAVRLTVNMGPVRIVSRGCEGKRRCELDPGDVWEPLEVDGRTYPAVLADVGNPHAVLLWEDPYRLKIEEIGPKFENHERFPDRTNTEFIEVAGPHDLTMRVWERGSGETLACGTGACASAAALAAAGLVSFPVTVHLRGGDLVIEAGEGEDVLMTGEAAEVFTGEIETEVSHV